MAAFEEFEGGVAVAEAPEEQKVIEVEAEPVDTGIEMEWEVETVPADEPAVETVTEETVVEEYYEPDYRQDYGRGFGQGYFRDRRVSRRINKHVYTWLLSFVFGIYGADRFFRGQIGLGLLKLLTFGGFGFWYLADVIIAAMNSYAGPYRNSDDVAFDQYGQFIF